MQKRLDVYEEKGFGLPYAVTIYDGAELEIDDTTGEELGIVVPNLEELAAVVAIARALNPAKLDGREVRFMRRVVGMSGAEFAAVTSVDPATLSRWENNRLEVGAWADKQIRQIAVLLLRDAAPHLVVDAQAFVRMRIQNRPDGEWPRIEVRRTPDAAEEPGETAGYRMAA